MISRQLMTSMLTSLCCAAALTACGQKGPLYLPDQTSEVITRPTQTPPEATPVPAPPAPELPAPEPDKDKNKNGTPPPPK